MIAKWISLLLGSDQSDLKCLKETVKNGLEARVSVYSLKDGTPAYLVEIYWLDPAGGPPAGIAWFNEQDLGDAVDLLNDAGWFIDEERRGLPHPTSED